MDNDDIYRRALAAYFRSGAIMQPAANLSGVFTAAGKHYVVLRSGADIYAVYRVRNDGMLKRLKRWPKELEE
jgi:hypothetical protein